MYIYILHNATRVGRNPNLTAYMFTCLHAYMFTCLFSAFWRVRPCPRLRSSNFTGLVGIEANILELNSLQFTFYVNILQFTNPFTVYSVRSSVVRCDTPTFLHAHFWTSDPSTQYGHVKRI